MVKYSAVLLAVLAGSLVSVNAESQSLRKLQASRRCPRSSSTPQEYRSVLNAFESETDETSALPPVSCDAETRRSVVWAPDGPNGFCGSTYDFEASIGSCCGGFKNANRREIEATLEFDNVVRDIGQIEIMVVPTYERRDCCDDCSCWGDPHCSPLGGNRRVDLRSFVPCDTADRIDTNTCTNRVENSPSAKERCLGTAAGFERNGPDGFNCEWLGDNEDYDRVTMGGPCRTKNKVDMLMFGITDPGTVIGGSGDEPGMKVLIQTGERGVGEKLKIDTVSDGGSTDSYELNVKEYCGSFELNGERMEADGDNDATANFSTDRFSIQRNLAVVGGLSIDAPITFEQDGFTGIVNCKGATFSNDDNEGASIKDVLSKQSVQTTAIKSALGGKSSAEIFNDVYKPVGSSATGTDPSAQTSRSQKQTILDTKVFLSKTLPEGVTGVGFCFDGVFAENTAEDTQTCPINDNLDFKDRQTISALPICQEFLEANNCDNFVDFENIRFETSRSMINARSRYFEIMEKCIIAYCSTEAFIPASKSILECYTDFYDFGSDSAIAYYPPKESVEGSAVEANEVETKVPVQQLNCEEALTVEYEAEGQETIVQSVEFNKPLILNIGAKPKKITLIQQDCAGTCGTRPKLDLQVKFSTVCEELDTDEYECVNTDEYVVKKKEDFPCLEDPDFTCA